jgi:hypothetical protein
LQHWRVFLQKAAFGCPAELFTQLAEESLLAYDRRAAGNRTHAPREIRFASSVSDWTTMVTRLPRAQDVKKGLAGMSSTYSFLLEKSPRDGLVRAWFSSHLTTLLCWSSSPGTISRDLAAVAGLDDGEKAELFPGGRGQINVPLDGHHFRLHQRLQEQARDLWRASLDHHCGLARDLAQSREFAQTYAAAGLADFLALPRVRNFFGVTVRLSPISFF